MKWLMLSLALLFVAGCQSTASTSPSEETNRIHSGGCSS